MIYLLRHGEIVDRHKKRYIGQTDVPLSAKGLRQAAWWQKKLSSVQFDGVYTSDLTRAFDTAKKVVNMPDSQMHVLKQLREISLGDWEGVPMEKIKTRFPDAWEERGRHMGSFKPPNGESFQDLHDRVIPVFQKITTEAWGNILMIGHAGVNRVILCHVLQKPIQELFRIPQAYGALNLIENGPADWVVRSMNILPSADKLDQKIQCQPLSGLDC